MADRRPRRFAYMGGVVTVAGDEIVNVDASPAARVLARSLRPLPHRLRPSQQDIERARMAADAVKQVRRFDDAAPVGAPAPPKSSVILP